MNLSMWEHNRKPVHPKYVKAIVNYLGYVPNVTSKFEQLGTRTQLYRMKHKLTVEEFCHLGDIPTDVVIKLETMRFCKDGKNEEKTVRSILNRIPRKTFDL
ncbi:MAG: hypothetical protein ACK5M1_07690 [Xanthomarina gelatinilytica]|uniref:hypothetical protein n=1 Tax=Xanthomarina gelatinilytica TaxID=1137281 RepID=UPI003A873C2D